MRVKFSLVLAMHVPVSSSQVQVLYSVVMAMWGRVRFRDGKASWRVVTFRQGIARRRQSVARCGIGIAWRITVRTRSGKVAFGGDSYAQAIHSRRSEVTVGQGMILYCAGEVR